MDRILRATNSTFSLIPAEAVSGTFIKVAQRVPIRIALDAPSKLPLGPGLSVVVHIHVGGPTAPGVALGEPTGSASVSATQAAP